MIIVDTNVIAYFIVPGETTQLAETVRGRDAAWAAPWLWRSEMRNLLTLYVRRGLLGLEDIKAHMANSEKLLSGREYEVGSDEVLTLAANSGCTSYDCEFVYLAEKLNVPLVTSDKKVLATFPNLAVSMDVFVR